MDLTSMLGKGVLIGENRAAHMMDHVEATCKNVVISIFGCLLQGDDIPPSCNLFFEGNFFSPSGSRVPVVDAESPQHNRTGSKVLIVTVHVIRCSRFPF